MKARQLPSFKKPCSYCVGCLDCSNSSCLPDCSHICCLISCDSWCGGDSDAGRLRVAARQPGKTLHQMLVLHQSQMPARARAQRRAAGLAPSLPSRLTVIVLPFTQRGGIAMSDWIRAVIVTPWRSWRQQPEQNPL